jgi:hypothetical protein
MPPRPRPAHGSSAQSGDEECRARPPISPRAPTWPRTAVVTRAAVFAAALAASGIAVVPVVRSTALADEPPKRTIDMGRAFDAAAPPTLPEIAITPTPPDPPPLVADAAWIFDLRWERGEPFLLGVRALRLPAPQATPRAMGRFAVELFEGPALVERVRFDFPLLGVLDPDGGPSLTAKLRTRVGVVFPATPRGTRLELRDRATGRRFSLPWPPKPTVPDADADGEGGGAGARALALADGGVRGP